MKNPLDTNARATVTRLVEMVRIAPTEPDTVRVHYQKSGESTDHGYILYPQGHSHLPAVGDELVVPKRESKWLPKGA